MSDNYRAQLLHALRRVLKPLARILFRAGVRFDEFIELLRGIYVEIVVADAAAEGKQVSAARIAILTGVPSRDVHRLVESDSWLKIPKPTDAPALAELLHRWHTDSTFLGPYGVPLELPIASSGGRSFADLVHGCPIKIEADSALEQLLAARMVARSGDTHVKVLSRSYVTPEPLSAEMLEQFGTAMTRLASTLHFNMTPGSTKKRLEKSVWPSEGLPEELLPEFDAYIRERANEMLSDIDDWLADVARRADTAKSLRVHTGVSVFHYVAPADAPIQLKRHVVPLESET